MDDFPSLFAKDFGIKPQGKSAPMAPPRNSAPAGGGIPDFGLRSDFGRSSYSNSKSATPIFDDHDRDVGNIFNDVYSGPPKHSSESRSFNAASSSLDYDSIFKDEKAKYSSGPVFDKPVYDDDIFEGVPGLKSSSVPSTAKYDDMFSSMSSPPLTKDKVQSSSMFDDLLGGIGRKDAEVKNQSQKVEKGASTFDDLLPGFGRSTSPVTARYTVIPILFGSSNVSSAADLFVTLYGLFSFFFQLVEVQVPNILFTQGHQRLVMNQLS